jgi:uncharacterized protein YqhQ
MGTFIVVLLLLVTLAILVMKVQHGWVLTLIIITLTNIFVTSPMMTLFNVLTGLMFIFMFIPFCFSVWLEKKINREVDYLARKAARGVRAIFGKGRNT